MARPRWRGEFAMTRRTELLNAYSSWIRGYSWTWFGVLTFRGYPRRHKADRLFRQWVSEVQSADGAKDFRWVRVTEFGADGRNLHFHILVGGLLDGSKYEWMFRWDEIAGEADIYYYVALLNGVEYVLKTLSLDRDFDIDFHFPPPTLPGKSLPRRKK